MCYGHKQRLALKISSFHYCMAGGGAGWGEKQSVCVRWTCSPWMMIIFKDSDGNRSCYYAHHYKYNQSLVQLSNLFFTTKFRLIVKLAKKLRN